MLSKDFSIHKVRVPTQKMKDEMNKKRMRGKWNKNSPQCFRTGLRPTLNSDYAPRGCAGVDRRRASRLWHSKRLYPSFWSLFSNTVACSARCYTRFYLKLLVRLHKAGSNAACKWRLESAAILVHWAATRPSLGPHIWVSGSNCPQA